MPIFLLAIKIPTWIIWIFLQILGWFFHKILDSIFGN